MGGGSGWVFEASFGIGVNNFTGNRGAGIGLAVADLGKSGGSGFAVQEVRYGKKTV